MAEKKGFNLAEALGAVPDLGTTVPGREQIEYIDIDKLDADANNFYAISGVDELAANISMLGLQQPIRVRATEGDRFTIVSGHRRRAALQKLVDDGMADFRQVPCIRDKSEGSAALQELRLIFANSDTRRMTSAEIAKEAERVEALLYQLKEEGYEFPGRMRDHVAEACKVSKSKLARLKVIRDNLSSEWRPYYEKSVLSESVAYALAKMPEAHQQTVFAGMEKKKREIRWLYESEVDTYARNLAAIDELICSKDGGAPCSNSDNKHKQAVYQDRYSLCYCGKCCKDCPNLATCKNACPKLAEKIKKLKADASARRKQEALAKEERERPTIQAIQRYWNRFGEARNRADKTVQQALETMGDFYSTNKEDDHIAKECLEAKFTTQTLLPFGYSFYVGGIEKLVKTADLFDCSLDYLLCRTDDPKGVSGAAVSAPAGTWSKGVPDHPCTVVGVFDCGKDVSIQQIVRWDGECFRFTHGAKVEAECVRWYPLPEEDAV